MPDYDVLTFGETMLRFSAPGFGRLEEAVTLDVRVGGSESNTAVALARLGMKAAWFSRLPATPLGRRVENEIRRWGVDTHLMLWDRDPAARVGTYFLDFGVPPRGIDVYYDRADSAVARTRPEEIDFRAVGRTRLLHLTGITTAIGPGPRETVNRLIREAKRQGVLVSFDVNHRSKLWTAEAARAVLEPLLPEIDLLLCPLTDAALIFELNGTGPQVARSFHDHYGVANAVITCGGEGSVACDTNGEYAAAPLALGQIVDRVGAGDAFNAGVLMGFLEGDLARGLRYGTAMAALKHTMPGDLLLSTRDEIEAAVNGGGGGIRR